MILTSFELHQDSWPWIMVTPTNDLSTLPILGPTLTLFLGPINAATLGVLRPAVQDILTDLLNRRIVPRHDERKCSGGKRLCNCRPPESQGLIAGMMYERHRCIIKTYTITNGTIQQQIHEEALSLMSLPRLFFKSNSTALMLLASLDFRVALSSNHMANYTYIYIYISLYKYICSIYIYTFM